MVREIILTFDNADPLSNETLDFSGNEKLIGLAFEAGFNHTSISFEAYDNNRAANEFSVNDLDQTELVLAISQTVDGYYPVDPLIFAGIAKLKVRRGTQAAPFSTGAEDTLIKVLVREY